MTLASRSGRITDAERSDGVFPGRRGVEANLRCTALVWVSAVRRVHRLVLARASILSAVILMPGRLAQIRAKGGDEAVEMARFLRSAEVWAILMIGSALALAAAVIQLALAYQ